MPPPCTVCLIEDEPLLLDALYRMFKRQPDFKMVGSYLSAERALADTKWEDVNLLIVDLELPGMSGIDLISRLAGNYPGLKILVFTSSEQRPIVLSAIRLGACGYLLKELPVKEMLAAVRELLAGGAPMSSVIARMLIEEFQDIPRAFPQSEKISGGVLTSRETEILHWISRGLSRHQIGETLFISPATVHTHTKNIYNKLEAHNRTQAINRAKDIGLL